MPPLKNGVNQYRNNPILIYIIQQNSDLNDFQNNFISTYIDVTGDGKNYFYYSPIPNYKLVSMVQMNDPDVAVDNLAYFNDNNIYIVRLINSMEVGKIYSFHVFYVKFGING